MKAKDFLDSISTVGPDGLYSGIGPQDLMRFAALQAEEAMEWISVKERLPKIGEEVLVSSKDGNIFVADYDGMPDFVALGFIGNSENYFYYWMPLPPAPKEFVEQSKTK